MEELPTVRVFTEAMRSSTPRDEVSKRLMKRAEKMGLFPIRDGQMTTVYHPSSGCTVMILTVTPTEPKL